MMPIFKISLTLFISISTIFCQKEQPYPPLDLVSIPTSGTLPKGSFTLETLLTNGGGVLPKLSIGITNNFFIGLSFGIQDFISEREPTFNKPTPEIQIRYRLYDETQQLPAAFCELPFYCRTVAGKRLWVLSSHPLLGARVQMEALN